MRHVRTVMVCRACADPAMTHQAGGRSLRRAIRTARTSHRIFGADLLLFGWRDELAHKTLVEFDHQSSPRRRGMGVPNVDWQTFIIARPGHWASRGESHTRTRQFPDG